jgi:hypothetical protein
MSSYMIKGFLFLIGFMAISLSCDPEDRVCYFCSIEEEQAVLCYSFIDDDTLLIADFEKGENPTRWMGSLDSWQDTFLVAMAEWQYDSIGGGASASQYYASVHIQNNTGIVDGNWTGGGLSLLLNDCYAGNDLSLYDSLRFEIKVFGENNLHETRIKLQHAGAVNTPERHLFKYGNFPAQEWSTITIALDEFLLKPTDHLFHDWVALDFKRVTHLVTVSVNDNPAQMPVNGILGIDNVRFVKK